MMSDTEKTWTPTTEVVKDAACFGFPRRRLGEPRGIDRDSFDRWLAARDAEQREAGRLAALEEIASEFEHTRTNDPGTDWFYADAAKWIRTTYLRSSSPEGSAREG